MLMILQTKVINMLKNTLKQTRLRKNILCYRLYPVVNEHHFYGTLFFFFKPCNIVTLKFEETFEFPSEDMKKKIGLSVTSPLPHSSHAK